MSAPPHRLPATRTAVGRGEKRWGGREKIERRRKKIKIKRRKSRRKGEIQLSQDMSRQRTGELRSCSGGESEWGSCDGSLVPSLPPSPASFPPSPPSLELRPPPGPCCRRRHPLLPLTAAAARTPPGSPRPLRQGSARGRCRAPGPRPAAGEAGRGGPLRCPPAPAGPCRGGDPAAVAAPAGQRDPFCTAGPRRGTAAGRDAWLPGGRARGSPPGGTPGLEISCPSPFLSLLLPLRLLWVPSD